MRISTLLTVVGAQIHGSVTILRLEGFRKKKHEGGFIIQSRQKKTTRNAGEKGMEELENVRHSSMSHGT